MQLGNHLGNVLVTISDKKKWIADPITSSLISHFEPVMLSGTDYYPFGMPMRIGGDNKYKYKYGFNGKENDNEVKGGEGLQQDYGFRIYDPRLGRFLSVDPLTKEYPWYTPYQFAGNMPISAIDLDGLEPVEVMKGFVGQGAGKDWPGVAKKFMTGVVKTIVAVIGVITQTAAATHYGDKVPKEKFAEQFPPIPNNNIGKDIVVPLLTSPALLAKQIKENPNDPELWGEAFAMLVPMGYMKYRAATKGSPPGVALGIGRKLEPDGGVGPKLLGPFAESTNSYPHYNWKDPFGSLANPIGKNSFAEIFSPIVNYVVDGGGRIKFNLDFFDVSKAAKSKGKGLEVDGVSVTDWEFGQIIGNDKLFKGTDFYEDGKILTSKEKTALRKRYNEEASKTE